jgi:hypothetical protein
MHQPAAKATGEAIVRLAHRGLQATDLYARAIGVLRSVVAIDGWCGLIMDPATAMSTGGIHDYGIPPRYLPRKVENEYAEPDVNKFAELGRRCSPAAVLSGATAGHPERSTRYPSVLRPSSFDGELRVSLRCGKLTWGALVLLRSDGGPAFTPAEAALVAGAAPALGEGVRRSLLLSAGAPAAGYGLVLLDEENRLERTFGASRRRVKVIGRVPGEHSCRSLVRAVLDRASVGWRGLDSAVGGIRQLRDLRRRLLPPPTPAATG